MQFQLGDDSSFFDKDAPFEHWVEWLPHREQSGKVQFVTCRVGDSLPRDKCDEIRKYIDNFNTLYPSPRSASLQRQFHAHVGPMTERALDNGYGSCPFKIPENRNLMLEILTRFNNQQYDLLAYVIMPNHLHFLMNVYEGFRLENIMKFILSESASKLTSSPIDGDIFWMPTYFDRLIRSERDLLNKTIYIYKNPQHLPSTHYSIGGPLIETLPPEFLV